MHITPPGARRFQPHRSITLALVLAIALFGISRAAYAAYGKYLAQKDRTAKIAEELAATKSRENALEKENTWLTTDRAEEAVVRERYMVARPGERVIVVTPDEKSSAPRDVDASNTVDAN